MPSEFYKYMRPEKFKIKKLNPNATNAEIIETINDIAEAIDRADIRKPSRATLAYEEALKKHRERHPNRHQAIP
jgi:predicted CoA-binding protein